jgi:CIC family chloride channel protein
MTWRLGIGVVLVALSAAAFAILFRWRLGAVLRLVANVDDVVTAMRHAPPWVRLTAPALGGLLAGILGRFATRTDAGMGVGDVMEAVVVGRTRLSMRGTLLKSAASWLAIACGGSLGREGPLIQFGGAAGQAISERLRLPKDHTRLLIAAGTAAGFAAAYNTPFAAVLFVLEIVTGLVVIEAVLPTILATVLATSLTRFVVGEGPIYGQRAFRLESTGELLAFTGLGLVTAVMARCFVGLLSASEKAFQWHSLVLPWRSAAGGLIAGAIVAVLPEAAGNGYEPLNVLLDGNFEAGFVLLLLLGKCVATAASVSSGSPGGVFTPTLLIGGSVGLLYAHVLSLVGLSIGPPGGYALVGMAAAIAATTHAPLLAAVMVFELSGDYAIVIPLLAATTGATLFSRYFHRDSIYTAELHRRGVGWKVTLEGRRVHDV